MDLESKTKSYVVNVGVNDELADELAGEIANEINTKNEKIVSVVTSLKLELTAENTELRENALLCLINVLSKVTKNLLTKNEVNVIFGFLKSKIEDQDSLTNAMEGINTLISMHAFTQSDAVNVLKFLHEQYDPSKFLTKTRYIPFKMLQQISEKYEDKLSNDEKFSEIYTETFLHIASGEKDPRNLLISFSLNKLIITSFPCAEKFKEDLFDTLFCYFPISFKPPKNDPYNISAESLKRALRDSISSSQLFATDAFSNLVDKLNATSSIVKNETLKTLKLCVHNFGGQYCLEEWLPIWNAVKFELLHNGDDSDFEGILTFDFSERCSEKSNYQLSLEIMRSLGSALYSYNEDAFKNFFAHILEELKPNFKYNKNLRQSSTLLATNASANAHVFEYVINNTLPLIIKPLSNDMSEMKLEIMNLSFFFDAYISVYGKNSLADQVHIADFKNPMRSFKDDILMLLSKSLTNTTEIEVTLRTLAVTQFTKLILMKDFLSEEELSLIVQYIFETCLTDDDKNVYHASIEALKVLSELHEKLIHDVSYEKVMNMLPNTLDENEQKINGKIITKEKVCKVLLEISIGRYRLIKKTVIHLSNTLHQVSAYEGSSSYCFMLISALYFLFESNLELLVPKKTSSLHACIKDPLLEVLTNRPSTTIDHHNLVLLSTVLFFSTLARNHETHQDLLSEVNELFVKNQQIFDKPSRMIIPYSKIISGIDKNCTFSLANEIFEKCINRLIDPNISVNGVEKLGYLETLMILSNKWINPDSIEGYCDWENTSIKNLEALTWIIKGLIMKNSSVATAYLTKFMNFLRDEKLGICVAKLFEVFVLDINSFKFYRVAPWCNNVRLLYKQKLFNDIFDDLIDSFTKEDNVILKKSYLTSLSMILKHTPNNLIEPYMKKVFPLLLQALELPNTEVITSSLETLRSTAEQNALLITDHFHTLMALILKLIEKPTACSIRIKLLALRLLHIMPSIVPLNYSLAVKEEVLEAISPLLDDKRRIIRKQCVDTRHAFFELGRGSME